MAEQVQALMERMVAPLRDLRDRGIFTEEEIHQIVTRRRSSEYLLQKLSVSRSDYLRYIEAEILLEKLRKLRKQRVMQEYREKMRGGAIDGDDNVDNENHRSKQKKHAYQTSGPGDAHIVSNIHFIYQRLLKKFHYPMDVLLNYAEFAKSEKSFKVMSRVYAEGLQRYPREVGLWIQAASFEFFGHIARDDTKNTSTKLIGSSIQNARVLMQRGLRINPTSEQLWVQYFALELHYVMKLMGRKEILDECYNHNDSEDEGDISASSSTMLLPCQIIYKNGIKSIPDSLSFRLQFVETCRMFPRNQKLERYIIQSIEEDFGASEEAWVSRISFAEEQMKKKKSEVGDQGFLVMPNDKNEKEEEPMTKKRRLITKDTALELVNEALNAVPTAKMYLECSKYLQLRMRRLVQSQMTSSDETVDAGNEPNNDLTYLIRENEDVDSALARHSDLLEDLYSRAEEKTIHSCDLILDKVDFLASSNDLEASYALLEKAIESGETNCRLFLRWAGLSHEMAQADLIPKLSSAQILRKALDVTNIHERNAFLLLSTELMKHLMSQTPSTCVAKELKALFQKLLLISQGLAAPITSGRDEDEIEVNLAEVFLTYLEYTIPDGKCTIANNEVVRSIYSSIIFHSNFARSCVGKTNDELLSMKSFFDMCLHFEERMAAVPDNLNKKAAKKQKKQFLSKLYQCAIAFFESGSGDPALRGLLDSYQREYDKIKFSL